MIVPRGAGGTHVYLLGWVEQGPDQALGKWLTWLCKEVEAAGVTHVHLLGCARSGLGSGEMVKAVAVGQTLGRRSQGKS